MKTIALLLSLLLFVGIVPSVEAATCRTLNEQRICIIQIKRSAKNHWEYRASVSVDGVVTAMEFYDCRQKVKVQNDGRVVRSDRDPSVQLICSFFKR
ncbi:hypothetical protein [Phormidesmis sp. 146-33]